MDDLSACFTDIFSHVSFRGKEYRGLSLSGGPAGCPPTIVIASCLIAVCMQAIDGGFGLRFDRTAVAPASPLEFARVRKPNRAGLVIDRWRDVARHDFDSRVAVRGRSIAA